MCLVLVDFKWDKSASVPPSPEIYGFDLHDM